MLERICIILVINLIYYFRTLKFTYCSDDVPIFNDPKNKVFKNRLEKWYKQFTAAVRIEPKQDHAITTVLQAITASLVYVAFGANDISFLTAILFSFCPSNNQVSVWISGRWYMLVAILLLLCKTIPYLSPLFLIIASTHPAGFFSSTVFIGSPIWYISLLLPLIVLYRLKTIKFMVDRKRKVEAVKVDSQMDINRIIVAVKTIGFYAVMCFFPAKLTFYHSFLQSMSGNDIMRKRAIRKDWIFFTGLALLGYLVYSLWHWTPITYGVWWYVASIAPYSNLYRCNQEVAERYLYIGSIGLIYSLSHIIIGHPIAITVFIVGYMVRLWFYMPAFQDDYWLLEYAVQEDPGAWFAWHTRARKRFDQGALREALNMWVMAKLISPKEFKLLINIATVLRILRNVPESDSFLKQAEDNIIPGQEEQAMEIIQAVRDNKQPICL